MPGMKLITLYVPQRHLEILDDLVRLEVYPNRAEAIRLAIRDLVIKERYLILRQGDRGPRT